MNCKYCGEPIRDTGDNTVPFVHVFGGNGFCDCHSISDAFSHRGMIGRTEAEPDSEDLEESAGVNLSRYLFSQN